ncbi:MAG TPA: hypothetical protein VFE57_05800, partial [Cyclobacteriaceae bacterium]|nr:hypothetical protein [Cyclobacteriaceae bacterium]
MASQLALEKQSLHALYNVSDLFERYFETFVRDNNAFKQKEVIEALGVLCFFYTIPYNDDEVLTKVLSVFSISKADFIMGIEKLAALELVEIEFGHVKMGDQNVSIYFFYKFFLLQRKLSFDQLLVHFFESHSHRFDELIIYSNNIFGYTNIADKVKPSLDKYLISIKSDEGNVFNFLKHFWFYLREETLDFIHQKILYAEIPEGTKFVTDYDENNFQYEDSYLEVLAKYLHYPTEVSVPLELGSEYCRRKPQYLGEWIGFIERVMLFDREDELTNFARQKALIELISHGVSQKDLLYISVFFKLSVKLLQFEFQQTKPEGEGVISLYRYPIPFSESIKEIRIKIWEVLEANFRVYPEEGLNILVKHGGPTIDFNKEIFEFDLTYVFRIIDENLSPEIFKHCNYVLELVRWSKRKLVLSPELTVLKQKFTTPTYQRFVKLDWNMLRGREEYDFENYERFRELKIRDIKQSFLFTSLNEFQEFLDAYQEIKSSGVRSSEIGDSIDLIIETNITNDNDLGLEMLLSFVKNTRNNGLRFYRTTHAIANRPSLGERFWNFLVTLEHSEPWCVEYLCAIPEMQLHKSHLTLLLDTIRNTTKGFYVDLKAFEKYKAIENNIFEIVIDILVTRKK